MPRLSANLFHGRGWLLDPRISSEPKRHAAGCPVNGALILGVLSEVRVSIRRTRLRIVLMLVAAENDDEDDPEAALPRVYSYNVTTP